MPLSIGRDSTTHSLGDKDGDEEDGLAVPGVPGWLGGIPVLLDRQVGMA